MFLLEIFLFWVFWYKKREPETTCHTCLNTKKKVLTIWKGFWWKLEFVLTVWEGNFGANCFSYTFINVNPSRFFAIIYLLHLYLSGNLYFQSLLKNIGKSPEKQHKKEFYAKQTKLNYFTVISIYIVKFVKSGKIKYLNCLKYWKHQKPSKTPKKHQFTRWMVYMFCICIFSIIPNI